MVNGGYNPRLVNAINNLLENTRVQYNDTTIPTKRGVPQGSCLSPDLWAIGMADLCSLIENIKSNESVEGSTACCFADDILLFANDRSQLTIGWRRIKKWSTENKVPINFLKCEVMELRIDQRTPRSLSSPLNEVPLVPKLKYLGVIFHDDMKMTQDIKIR